MLRFGWSYAAPLRTCQHRLPAQSCQQELQTRQACADPSCGPMADSGEIGTLQTAGLEHQSPHFRTRDYRCQLRRNTGQELKQGKRLLTCGTQPGTAGDSWCFQEGLASSESFSFMNFFCEAFETLHLQDIH